MHRCSQGSIVLKTQSNVGQQKPLKCPFSPTLIFSVVVSVKEKEPFFVSCQTASLLEEAHKLKDESFLILHGTADGEILFIIITWAPHLTYGQTCQYKPLSCSEGTLSAQCGAPQPTGEDRRQLLTAAVPRRGPHLERSTQRPAFQTDGGQLLSQLPKAKPLSGTYRRWRRRRWLNTWKELFQDSVPS